MANRHTKQLCVCTPGRFFLALSFNYTPAGNLVNCVGKVHVYAMPFSLTFWSFLLLLLLVCRSCHRIVLRLTISTVLLWVSTSLQWIWCVCSVFSVSSLRVFLGFYRCHWHYIHSNFIYAKFIDLSCVYW